jgi:hypothetical protein
VTRNFKVDERNKEFNSFQDEIPLPTKLIIVREEEREIPLPNPGSSLISSVPKPGQHPI